MHDLLSFLRAHPLAWLLPIVAYIALLVGVAWLALRVPESPFAYSLY